MAIAVGHLRPGWSALRVHLPPALAAPTQCARRPSYCPIHLVCYKWGPGRLCVARSLARSSGVLIIEVDCACHVHNLKKKTSPSPPHKMGVIHTRLLRPRPKSMTRMWRQSKWRKEAASIGIFDRGRIATSGTTLSCPHEPLGLGLHACRVEDGGACGAKAVRATQGRLATLAWCRQR